MVRISDKTRHSIQQYCEQFCLPVLVLAILLLASQLSPQFTGVKYLTAIFFAIAWVLLSALPLANAAYRRYLVNIHLSMALLVIVSLVISMSGLSFWIFVAFAAIIIGGNMLFLSQPLVPATEEPMYSKGTYTLIDNLTTSFIGLDTFGTVTIFNASTLDLLNTNENINGKHIDDITNCKDMTGGKVSLYSLARNAHFPEKRDDIFMTVDNEDIRVEVRYSPIRQTSNDSGELPSGYIVLLRDVTKAKSLEDERDEFISVISHELRTPIAIAEGSIGNAQLLVQRKDVSKQKIEAAVDAAHEQIIFLARMINDLGTLSRVERGTADSTEIININELMHNMYHDYVKQAEQNNLKLNIDLPDIIGTVNVSPLYIKELLQNFMTNAIKYTKEGSITISAHSHKDGTVTLAVKDTGIGLSNSDKKRIFEKFYRAEDYRTRETSGSGLGLYVAAKLAKKIGTTIEVKSRLNHGSVFSITLPLEESAGQQ